jgi:hypothetical protein
MTWYILSLIPQKNVICINIFAVYLMPPDVVCCPVQPLPPVYECSVCKMDASIRQSLGSREWRVGEGNSGLTWALAGNPIFFKFSVLYLADMWVSQYENKNLYIVLTEHRTQVPLSNSPASAMRTGAHDLTQGTFGLNVYHPLNF